MFEGLPLAANIAIFGAAAIAVWLAGTRVAEYAAVLARRTGMGHAAAGLLLLAGITSLPEIAVTVTASAGGNAALAVNNLLGSVAMQVAILAIADAVIGRDALTSVIPNPVVLTQISLNVLVLSLVAAAVVVGDRGVLGVGVWSCLLVVAYIGSIWLLSRTEGRRTWVIDPEARPPRRPRSKVGSGDDGKGALAPLLARTVGGGAVILGAGFLLAKTGEAIATHTGLGQSLGGYLLVAVSTSLPEASTVIASVKLGRYVMAMSDIFGTNLFNGGLLFLVDAVYRGGPVLDEVGAFTAFAALLGVLVSALYLLGLLERRDRTVLRMGYDSFAVLATYLLGVGVLFSLR